MMDLVEGVGDSVKELVRRWRGSGRGSGRWSGG